MAITSQLMSSFAHGVQKGFIVLSNSAGLGEFQKKSLHKSDTGNGVYCIFSKWRQ